MLQQLQQQQHLNLHHPANQNVDCFTAIVVNFTCLCQILHFLQGFEIFTHGKLPNSSHSLQQYVWAQTCQIRWRDAKCNHKLSIKRRLKCVSKPGPSCRSYQLDVGTSWIHLETRCYRFEAGSSASQLVSVWVRWQVRWLANCVPAEPFRKGKRGRREKPGHLTGLDTENLQQVVLLLTLPVFLSTSIFHTRRAPHPPTHTHTQTQTWFSIALPLAQLHRKQLWLSDSKLWMISPAYLHLDPITE